MDSPAARDRGTTDCRGAQRERIDRLTKQGQDTGDAQILLGAYERTLAIFEDDFVRLSKTRNKGKKRA